LPQNTTARISTSQHTSPLFAAVILDPTEIPSWRFVPEYQHDNEKTKVAQNKNSALFRRSRKMQIGKCQFLGLSHM